MASRKVAIWRRAAEGLKSLWRGGLYSATKSSLAWRVGAFTKELTINQSTESDATDLTRTALTWGATSSTTALIAPRSGSCPSDRFTPGKNGWGFLPWYGPKGRRSRASCSVSSTSPMLSALHLAATCSGVISSSGQSSTNVENGPNEWLI